MSADPFHISISEFDIRPESLGSGSYSEIVLALHKGENKKYAIKVVNKNKAERHNNVKYFVNERRVMLMLEHHRIVKLRWTTKDEENIYFIYDMAPNGELWEILRGFQSFVPHPTIRRIWASQLFSAVEYCHLNFNLAHRDLKPENVLIDENFNLLLCDFGTSKVMKKEVLDAEHNAYLRAIAEATIRVDHMEHERKSMNLPPGLSGPDVLSADENRRRSILYQASRHNSFTGTPYYMAPEVIQTHGTRGTAADLWSLGVILFQLETGQLPFQHESPYGVLNEVVEFKCNLNLVTDDIARDLIRQLLTKDPRYRLGVVGDDQRLLYGYIAPIGVDYDPAMNSPQLAAVIATNAPPKPIPDNGDLPENYLDEIDPLTKRCRPKLLSETTISATAVGWKAIRQHPYFTRTFSQRTLDSPSQTPNALHWDCDLPDEWKQAAKQARGLCFNFITYSDENGNPVPHPKQQKTHELVAKEELELAHLEQQLAESFPTIPDNLPVEEEYSDPPTDSEFEAAEEVF